MQSKNQNNILYINIELLFPQSSDKASCLDMLEFIYF